MPGEPEKPVIKGRETITVSKKEEVVHIEGIIYLDFSRTSYHLSVVLITYLHPPLCSVLSVISLKLLQCSNTSIFITNSIFVLCIQGKMFAKLILHVCLLLNKYLKCLNYTISLKFPRTLKKLFLERGYQRKHQKLKFQQQKVYC